MNVLSSNGQARAPLDDCWNQIGVQGDRSCPKLEQQLHCRNCPVYAAAAQRLLERELPPDHFATWTVHFARPNVADAASRQSVFIFRVGAEWLCLSTGALQAVEEVRTIHSLPHRRNGVLLGLANVRGELLVCVSLGQLLGAETATGTLASARGQRFLVLQRGSSRFVAPVDEVHGVQLLSSTERIAAPATITGATAPYTSTMLRWRDRAVGCLNESRVFDALERSLA